jgi:hypothetical protein
MTTLECEPVPISLAPSVARTVNSICRPSLDVVVEGRADKDADLQIGAFGLPPIVKAVDQRFETRERQAASLPRLRDQAITAYMRAWRVTQRKPQLLSDDFPRHS